MESLRLDIEACILGQKRNIIVEVPYQNGLVATSEFCPTELLSGDINLFAAVRGESLDCFMKHCRCQLTAMSKITEADTPLDCHIGALMAVVMDRLDRLGHISMSDLLIQIDCFSLLLKACGFAPDEIRAIYPQVSSTIRDLYPDCIRS